MKNPLDDFELDYFLHDGQLLCHLGVQLLERHQYDRAIYWFRKAMLCHYEPSYMWITYCYAMGYGVEKDLEFASDRYTKICNKDEYFKDFPYEDEIVWALVQYQEDPGWRMDDILDYAMDYLIYAYKRGSDAAATVMDDICVACAEAWEDENLANRLFDLITDVRGSYPRILYDLVSEERKKLYPRQDLPGQMILPGFENYKKTYWD